MDQAFDLEAGQLAGDLGGPALGVVEVGGNRDDRFLDLLAEMGLGIGLERAQHQGGELLGAEGLLAELDLAVAAHVALEVGGG